MVYSLFITYLLVYVGDIIIFRRNTQIIQKLKSILNTKFHIKHLGKLKFFLGLELFYLPIGVHVNQRKYTLDLIKDYGLIEAKPSMNLMDRNTNF